MIDFEKLLKNVCKNNSADYYIDGLFFEAIKSAHHESIKELLPLVEKMQTEYRRNSYNQLFSHFATDYQHLLPQLDLGTLSFMAETSKSPVVCDYLKTLFKPLDILEQIGSEIDQQKPGFFERVRILTQTDECQYALRGFRNSENYEEKRYYKAQSKAYYKAFRHFYTTDNIYRWGSIREGLVYPVVEVLPDDRLLDFLEQSSVSQIKQFVSDISVEQAKSLLLKIFNIKSERINLEHSGILENHVYHYCIGHPECAVSMLTVVDKIRSVDNILKSYPKKIQKEPEFAVVIEKFKISRTLSGVEVGAHKTYKL